MRHITPALMLLCAGGASAALVISPALAVLPLGALLLWLWVYNPSLGLVAAVAVYPLQRSLLGMPAYAVSAAPALLTGMSVLIRGGLGLSVPSFRRNAPQYLAVILFTYTLLSLAVRAISEQPGALMPDLLATEGPTFYKYTGHALLLFLLTAYLVRSRNMVKRLTWVHLALLGIITAIGLHAVASGSNTLLEHYWGAREALSLIGPRFDQMTGIFFDSNRFANFLVSTFFICLPVVVGARERLRTKLLAIPVLGTTVVCVYLSFSVTNWLAILTGSVIWLVLWGKRRALLVMGAAALIAVLLASNFGTPSMTFMPPNVYDKVDALARLDFGPDSPLHIRVDLIRGGMEMFRANPVFGVGYGGYQPWIAKSGYYMEATKQIVYSHNSYVLVLAELGVIGLGMLLALLASCVFYGLRNISRAASRDLKARQIGLLAAVGANLVFLASYDSILYSLNLWIPLGLTVALTRVIENKRGKEGAGDAHGPSNGGEPHV